MKKHLQNQEPMLRSLLKPEFEGMTVPEFYAHMRSRSSVEYFAVLDENETQQHKLEAILQNVFTFNHETYRLPEAFSWRENPSRDIEWLIMLHKFYYGVGLAKLYHETGDAAYKDKWIELTRGWMDAVEPGFIASDVTGRRIQNWIFAHYYLVTLGEEPCLPDDFYARFLCSIHQQTDYLCANLTPARNHRTLELYAVFLSAVVFPEFRAADFWLQFSRREIAENIKQDILPDGVHCELSTDYHHIVLRNLLSIRRLAFLNRIPFDPEADERIKRALTFSMYVHKPDGFIPALSDGDTGNYLSLVELGSELYGDEQMRYVATKGKQGLPPERPSREFRDSGYYILRSGWGAGHEPFEDERHLIFDCGPLGRGNHGHFDLLNITAAGFGKDLLVDPGRYTYDESGEVNWRVRFRGTRSHNTVQVDGKNQTRYTFNARKGKFKIDGPPPDYELKRFFCKRNCDYVHGVARSHEYEAIHARSIFFVRPDYWIVTDLLDAQDMHTYELRFHLSPQAYGRTHLLRTASGVCLQSPNLLLVQPGNSHIRVHLESGYVAPSYGERLPVPVVRAHARCSRIIFHTVVYPFRATAPQITLDQLPVVQHTTGEVLTSASALQITIREAGCTTKDIYYSRLQAGPGSHRFAEFRYDGQLFFTRKPASGEPVVLHRDAGSDLRIERLETAYV